MYRPHPATATPYDLLDAPTHPGYAVPAPVEQHGTSVALTTAVAPEMIQRSVAIAIVDIPKVEPVEAKGKHWTYRQRAHATVHRTLKGSLPKTVPLFGNETFICAQVRFKPSRYLAFLSKDGEKFVGANWHLSVRPIKDDQVEWYSGKQHLDLSWQPLSAVLDQVSELIK